MTAKRINLLETQKKVHYGLYLNISWYEVNSKLLNVPFTSLWKLVAAAAAAI